MNKNAMKTALMFLGIIFFVLMGRLFFSEHALLVIQDEEVQVANTICAQNEESC